MGLGVRRKSVELDRIQPFMARRESLIFGGFIKDFPTKQANSWKKSGVPNRGSTNIIPPKISRKTSTNS